MKVKGPLAHEIEEVTSVDLDTDAASTVILNDRYKFTVTCVTYVGKNATLEKLAIPLLVDSSETEKAVKEIGKSPIAY